MARKDATPVGRSIGEPFVLTARIAGTSNATHTAVLATKQAPTGTAFRVADAWWYTRVKRTGGTPVATVQLLKGDGAASEAFTAVSPAADAHAATVDAPVRWATIADGQDEVAGTGQTLKVDLVVSGGTTGQHDLDVYVLCIPVE